MIEYFIVKGTDNIHLSKVISDFLKEGWKLHGGLCLTVVGDKLYYAQAITRDIVVDSYF